MGSVLAALSGTSCSGELKASSNTARVALSSPRATAGAKVTWMMHECCGATAAVQPDGSALKSEDPVEIPVWDTSTCSGSVPLFVTVTFLVGCAPLTTSPKATADGTLAAGASPLPVRAIACGLSAASSVRERVAARVPGAVGVKSIAITQESPG